MYLFLAALGLHHFASFSLIVARGATLCCEEQASHSVASLVAELGLEGLRASVIVAHGLSICSSQTLDHRLNSCDSGA